jgi:hypothetical protein
MVAPPRKISRRGKSIRRRDPSKAMSGSDMGDWGDAKRQWDRVRRLRLKSFRHLYLPLETVDEKACYYCGGLANTLDHCPPLLMVDSVGVSYFQERGIPFLLIPACGRCNNDMGTAHVFQSGRVVRLDWGRLKKHVRAHFASKEHVDA